MPDAKVELAALVAAGFNAADASRWVQEATAALPEGADPATWLPPALPFALTAVIDEVAVQDARADWYVYAPVEWKLLLDDLGPKQEAVGLGEAVFFDPSWGEGPAWEGFNPYHDARGRFTSKGGAAVQSNYSVQTAAGRVDVQWDTESVAADDAAVVKTWMANIPDTIWEESELRSMRVFEDPENVLSFVEATYPDTYINENTEVRGIYDSALRQAAITRWSSEDMYGQDYDGVSGRNFYHEFAHSTPLDTRDGWFAVMHEWPVGENREVFADAFADWMVAHHYYEPSPRKGRYGSDDETYLQGFERTRPATSALFREWGL